MTRLLTNNLGGYFLSGISSRYAGLFFLLDNRMLKIADDSFPDNCKISMLSGKNIIIIESKKFIQLQLDVKESYDNPEFGRFYELKEEKAKNIALKVSEQTNSVLVEVRGHTFILYRRRGQKHKPINVQ